MRNVLILPFFLVILSARAEINPDSLYLRANRLYAEGRYAEAATLYDSLISEGYKAPEVYFNLGNAYFKMRQLGRAILNYERASRLRPSDEDINFNLQLARAYTVDKIENLPEFFLTSWWKSFCSLLSSNTWIILSIISFIACLILILIFLLTTRISLKKLFLSLTLFFLLLFGITFFSGMQQRKELREQKAAIVMAPSVTAKSSPDAGSSDLFVLHEGTKVRIEDAVGTWVEIRIANGNKGWIESSNLEII